MTFQESARCPVCLELGKLRYQYGSYCCDKCDQCFRADTLTQFMKAFESGRVFERNKKPEFVFERYIITEDGKMKVERD